MALPAEEEPCPLPDLCLIILCCPSWNTASVCSKGLVLSTSEHQVREKTITWRWQGQKTLQMACVLLLSLIAIWLVHRQTLPQDPQRPRLATFLSSSAVSGVSKSIRVERAVLSSQPLYRILLEWHDSNPQLKLRMFQGSPFRQHQLHLPWILTAVASGLELFLSSALSVPLFSSLLPLFFASFFLCVPPSFPLTFIPPPYIHILWSLPLSLLSHSLSRLKKGKELGSKSKPWFWSGEQLFTGRKKRTCINSLENNGNI